MRGGGYRAFILLACILVGNTLLLKEFTQFSAAWVNCYILGMFFGKLKFHSRRRKQIAFKIGIYFFALAMNAIQIVTDYTNVPLYSVLLNGRLGSLYSMFCNYAHVFLGLALFIGLHDLFAAMLKNRDWPLLEKICAVSDGYSYQVYLVHQWLILGPLSLMTLTPWMTMNVGIVIIGIALLVIMVGMVERCIKQMITVLKK